MHYPLDTSMLDDIQRIFDEVALLLQRHGQWLDTFNQSLFYDAEPSDKDLRYDAHRHCCFGKWIYQQDSPLLKSSSTFAELKQVHRQMHQEARQLLLKRRQGHRIGSDEYAQFSTYVAELLRLVIRLESGFKQRLSNASRLTARVFESASEAVAITDARAIIIDVNSAFEQVTGYRREEVTGQSVRLLKSGYHDEDFYQEMWRALQEQGCWQGEIWNRRRTGEIYPEWLSINAIHEDGSATATHYVAMFSDISEAKRNEERLYRLAHYDSLTGLPNRGLFRESLAKAIAWAGRNNRMVAVLFLDLDRFKVINDTLGHNAGDALLIDVAHRLLGSIREADTVARQGGDEFTIVVTDLVSPSAAARVARKIIEVMAVPFTIEGQELFVTTSIGIGLFPKHGNDPESLIKAADIAMYQAKEHGRDGYAFYRAEGQSKLGEVFELENGLRRALERNELRIFYQPQVDTATGSLVGVEALLRWFHPDRGLLLPDAFIPIAEETGLINVIGRWVLDEACQQAKSWQERGIGQFRMSVNLSGRQLRQDGLPRQVAAALEKSGLAAEFLQLELTETSVMQNPVSAARLLSEIRELGVSISIDDFGSGYTSLSYLKRLPIDSVKIDKEFISGVVDDPDDRAISLAIVALASSLELKVVAEGVENEAQLTFLRDNHCRDAQGYLFAPPLPADEFVTLLRSRLGRSLRAFE